MFRLRKKPINLCACNSEERERWVGAGVNATMLSETLQVVGLEGAAARAFQGNQGFFFSLVSVELNARLILEEYDGIFW